MIDTDITAFRPRLFGLAYRMLGTRADADDVVQDAFLRWQGADRATIRDPQAWLVTTTTRAAIDRLRALQAERERYTGPWVPEPIVGDIATNPERHAEMSEDLSVAFLYVLERLGPDERAAFILHDVFAYAHGEVAEILGRSEEAVRQMVHRARQRMRAERPRFTLDRNAASALVERFVRALESRDEAQLRAILTEDVTHVGDGGGVVPASGTRAIIGRERVAMLLLALHAKYKPRLELADVGGSPGLIIRGEGGAPQGVIALATDGEFIANIHVVVNPHKVANIFKTTQGPFTRTS